MPYPEPVYQRPVPVAVRPFPVPQPRPAPGPVGLPPPRWSVPELPPVFAGVAVPSPDAVGVVLEMPGIMIPPPDVLGIDPK